MKAINTTLILLILLSIGCGCGAAPERSRPTSFAVHSEDARLQEQLEFWAPRWAAASGVDVVASESGIPVYFVEDLTDEYGSPLCGKTVLAYNPRDPEGFYSVTGIEIDSSPPGGCSSWGYALGHELGHVIAGPQAEHGSDGVFAMVIPPGQAYRITEGSLLAACSHTPCSRFQPE